MMIIVTVLLIINYPSVRLSVINALQICGSSIIPSLFPISFLSTLLVRSGALSSVSSKVSIYILFAVSQSSGYPVGTLLINNAVKDDLMDKNCAEKIAPALICAGPSFIISFVGEQVFGNITAGIYLYISQIFANLIVFLILKKRDIRIRKTEDFSILSSFPDAVKNSATSVMTVCTYIVLFFALKPIIAKIFGSQITEYIIYFSEVSSAVLTSKNIYITCSVLAWSGFCVMLQIKSVASHINLSVIRIIKWRFVCVIISYLIFKILVTAFPIKSDVFSNITEKPMLSFGGSIGFVIVFIFSIFVLLLSLRKKTEGKILTDIL